MRVLIVSLLIVALMAYQAHAASEVLTGADLNNEQSCGNTDNGNDVPPPANTGSTSAAFNAWLSALLSTEDQIPKYTFENDAVGQIALPKTLEFSAANPDPDLLDFTSQVVCGSAQCSLRVKDNTVDNPLTPPCQSRNGRYANDGVKWLDVEENNDFVINFTSPVKGFAFFASDIGDVEGSLFLRIRRQSGGFLINPETGTNQWVLYNASVTGAAPSGVRHFWGVFTDSTNSDDFFTEVRFDKDTDEVDGFGFDSFYALPDKFEVPPVIDCQCTIVYNFDISCAQSQYAVTGPECACIRFESDASRGACEVETKACTTEGSEVPGGDPQSGGGGGAPAIPLRDGPDPANPYAPYRIVADD